MLEAIERIERYSRDGRERVEGDELRQTWIVYHLQILGEAARKVSEPLARQHPEVPWATIVAMRNILVHDYFGVDMAEVWNAVDKDVPALKRQIQKMLEGLT